MPSFAALALAALTQAAGSGDPGARDPAVFDAELRAVHAALREDNPELARTRFDALFVDHAGEAYVRERYAELLLLADWVASWRKPLRARDLVDVGARVEALRESSCSVELVYDVSGLEDFLAGDPAARYHSARDPQPKQVGDLFLFPAVFTDEYTVRLAGMRRGITTELHVAIQPSGQRLVVTFRESVGSHQLVAAQVAPWGQVASPRTVYIDAPEAGSLFSPFELVVEVAAGVVSIRHAGKPALEVELVGDALVPGQFGFVADGVTVESRRAGMGPGLAGPGFDARMLEAMKLFGGLRELAVEGEVDEAWLQRTLRGQRLIDTARRRGAEHASELVPEWARPASERPVHASLLRVPLGQEARTIYLELRALASKEGQDAALRELGRSRAARGLGREERAALEQHLRTSIPQAVELSELARARARAEAHPASTGEASSEALEWLWFLGRDDELEAWCVERLAADGDDAAAAGRLAALHLLRGRLDEAEALVRAFHSRRVTSDWLLEAGLGVASVRFGPVVPSAPAVERGSLRMRCDGGAQRYEKLLDPLAEACARWDALPGVAGQRVHDVWIVEDRSTFESQRETVLRDRAHHGLLLRPFTSSVSPPFDEFDDVLSLPGTVVAWGGAEVAALRQPLLLALARSALRSHAPHAPEWLLQGLVDYEAEWLAGGVEQPFDVDLYGRMRGELAATGSLTKLVSGAAWTADAGRASEVLETRRAAGLVAAHVFLATDGDGRSALEALLGAYASGADPQAALVARLGAEGVARLDRLFGDERLRLADPLRR